MGPATGMSSTSFWAIVVHERQKAMIEGTLFAFDGAV